MDRITMNGFYLLIFIFSSIIFVNTSDDRVVEHIRQMVHRAIDDESDSTTTMSNEILMEELSRILEEEEGFRLVDRQRRSLNLDRQFNAIFDGSGDRIDAEPEIYFNHSIIVVTPGATSAASTGYTTPQHYPPCPCEKGERGEKGDPGICPADCGRGKSSSMRDCLGPRINLERLAQSIRQLITDAKQIASRNAQATSCTCPVVPSAPSSSTVTSPSAFNRIPFDYNMYVRLKGEKGDPGHSCSPTCVSSSQSNIRIFSTLQEAREATLTYPDHTYVHIVNDYGQLQGVFIHINGRLIPIRLESESPVSISSQSLSTTLSIPKPKCSLTLPCPTLHLFALGPDVRRLCHPKRPNLFCSKLSELDDLCGRVAERQQLKGFYRAFMSTSTQWLSNLFAGICVAAKMVNMKEQTLFDSVDDMFTQKPLQDEILDVTGLKPQFRYWWHGSLVNGTASSDTCLDWSRRDSSLSGIASRLPDDRKGLFHYQYAWPCSISDSEMGILCIETNCDKRNDYKH